MNRTDFIAHLRDLDACDKALKWIDQTPGEPEDLWAVCRRGDWMIWLLVAVRYDKRTLRHIACDCAEDALHIYEQAYPDDRRPREYITLARRYADGDATDDELIAARAAAWNAAWAVAKSTDWTAAKSAAYAVAWAAFGDAAWAASNAATEAASSAAAKAASSAAAKAAAWARQADMIRARVSWADVERAMERTALAALDGEVGNG